MRIRNAHQKHQIMEITNHRVENIQVSDLIKAIYPPKGYVFCKVIYINESNMLCRDTHGNRFFIDKKNVIQNVSETKMIRFKRFISEKGKTEKSQNQMMIEQFQKLFRKELRCVTPWAGKWFFSFRKSALIDYCFSFDFDQNDLESFLSSNNIEITDHE